MKVRILEAAFIIIVQHQEIYGINLKNIIQRKYFTDFVLGGRDFVEMVKLVNHNEIKFWQ